MELGLAWRLRQQTREFARSLDELFFGGPEPKGTIVGLTPPRLPKVPAWTFTLGGHDVLRRQGAARLVAEKRGWRP